jgi:hypothetical protein
MVGDIGASPSPAPPSTTWVAGFTYAVDSAGPECCDVNFPGWERSGVELAYANTCKRTNPATRRMWGGEISGLTLSRRPLVGDQRDISNTVTLKGELKRRLHRAPDLRGPASQAGSWSWRVCGQKFLAGRRRS